MMEQRQCEDKESPVKQPEEEVQPVTEVREEAVIEEHVEEIPEETAVQESTAEETVTETVGEPEPRKQMDDDELFDLSDKAEQMLREETTVPVVLIELGDTEPDIFHSKIGGTPYIPHGFDIPVDKNGKQMKLLAQIDCKLLEGLPDYPHEGMLQFWLDTQYPWEEHKTVYHSTIDETVTEDEVRAKIDEFIEGETGSFPVIKGGYGIETELAEESMSGDDERCGKLLCKYMVELSGGRIIEEYDGSITDLFDIDITNGHKVGGYIYDPQEWLRGHYDPDFVSDIGSDDEKLLLFQLEYEHGYGEHWADNAKVILADCGIMHFYIKRKDLKALDFDNVTYDWSCS